MTDTPLRILHLEDSLADAELTQETLAANGITCDVTCVETESAFLAALQEHCFDLVLADYALPSFDGISALALVRRQSPDLPFIFVSGTMGEEVAIEALKVGATDYVLKTRLSRLVPAVRRALREANERAELHHAERELRERDAKIRRLVDANIVGVLIWDSEGQILDANDAFLRIVGYDRKDLLSGRLRRTDLLPAESLEPDKNPWMPGMKTTGSLQPFEKEYFRKDGSRVPVLIAPVTFEETSNQGVAFVLDLTERKQAEEAARRSEKQLRDVIETIPTLVWIARPDGSTEFANRRLVEYTGLSQAEAAGSGWELAIHPDDLDRYLRNWRASVASGEPFEEEMRLRHADGEYRWFLSRAVPLRDNQGKILNWYGVSTDIEDRKQAKEALERSEAYLAEAQKLTHTGSWAFHGTATAASYWSEENFRIWGFDPQGGFPTREMIEQRMHPEDRDRARKTGVQAVAAKTDWEGEFRIVLPDGTVRHIHGLGHPVLSAAGELLEAVGTHVDVTERKHAEAEREKLRQLEADLAHLNRITTMGELAVSLAHELKQPITAAITSADSCLQWLTHSPPNLDKARAAASRIKADANRAADVIDRLRSLYQKAPPKRDQVAVKGLIAEMAVLLRGEADRYAVSIRTDLAADLPMVMADRVQLQQVLLNLMLNAIEAMKETGGLLTIRSQPGPDGQVLISVTDTGIGLPAEKANEIFNAFFTTKPQGSGMGLTISRSIVESHGGHLWATANNGGGAAFHFTLPAAAAED
ncbi:MAG: PAS domain S-box protein [Silvibacterium sp.]|nr:PAS domain S-box protein [Silvibacterium sp.]